MEPFGKKKVRRITAAVVCAAMLVPVFVRGIQLDGFYTDEFVAKTWNLPQSELDKNGGYEETGLACNWTWIPRNENAGDLFPFAQAMYFTARPGYEKDKFKDFDNRFLYCVASHTQGYRPAPGQQMFFMAEYGISSLNRGMRSSTCRIP